MSDIADEVDSIIENKIKEIKKLKSEVSSLNEEKHNLDFQKIVSLDEKIEEIVLDTIEKFESNFNNSQAFYLHKEFLNASSFKISFCSQHIKKLITSKLNNLEKIEEYFDKLINFYVNSLKSCTEFIKTEQIRGETRVKYQIEIGSTLNNIGDCCLFLAGFEEKNYEKIYYFKLGFKILCEGLKYFEECLETNKDFFSVNKSKKIGSKFRKNFSFSGEKIIQCYEQLASFLNKKFPSVSCSLAKTGMEFYEEFEKHFKKKFSEYHNLKDSFKNIEKSKQKLDYYLQKQIKRT